MHQDQNTPCSGGLPKTMFEPFYESAVKQFGSNILFGFSLLNLKSDAERYQLVAPQLENLPFPNEPSEIKNEKMSVAAREDGNKFFRKGSYISALEAYTRSLALAPPNSIAFSLALANRSAVLKKMDYIDECMDDIQQALLNKYPAHLKYKLHQRNAECMILLHKYSEALLSFEKAISCLGDAKLTESEVKKITEIIKKDMASIIKMSKNIEVELASLSLNPRKKKSSNGDSSLLSYDQNPQIPGARNCFTLQHNEDIGRHLVATQDLSPGDALIFETAFAGFLFPENLYTHCSYCMQRFAHLLPCTECTWAMYCSQECLNADVENHKIECSLVPALLAWDMGEISMLLVRILIKTGISKVSEYLKTPDALVSDPLKKGFTNGQYQSMDFNAVYHLCRNSEKRSITDLFKRAVNAWCLVKCFGELLPDPDTFGGLFVRLLQSLATNGMSVSEIVTNFHGQEVELSVGGAVFPTHSLLTHSCEPNVCAVNNGMTKMVYVLQPIKKGSILTNNYGWKFMTHPKGYRQERSWSRHQFCCKCKACEENWPLAMMSTWPDIPYIYRNENDRRLCELSLASVQDLRILAKYNKEISSENAARICKHIQVLSDAGATKCRDYWLFNSALDIYFARKGARHVQKYP